MGLGHIPTQISKLVFDLVLFEFLLIVMYKYIRLMYMSLTLFHVLSTL